MEKKITKERIRNHFQYAWWQYLTLAIAAIFGWSLIFTTTAYRPPADKRFDVYFVTYSVPEETLNWFEEQIMGMFDDVEESDVMSIVCTPDDSYYGSMQMTTYMAAGQGDIYIMNSDRFNSLKSQEGFQPLDDAIAQGLIDLHGIDVTAGKAKTEAGEMYIAAIPAASLNKLKEYSVYNNDLYICIMSTSPNVDKAYTFVNWLIGEMYQEEEATEEAAPQTGTSSSGDMASY